jgi:undecaprenyl-diphosphatase
VNILKAIILGIIEGVTEFLPISSTGHLIIVGHIIAFFEDNKEFANFFDIFIQIGAIFAVLIYFRDKIIPPILKKSIIKSDKDTNNSNLSVKSNLSIKEYFLLWLKVLIAFIPAAIIGVILHDLITEYIFFPIYVAVALIVGATLMLIAELLLKKPKTEDENNITFKQAIIVGLFQCLSLFPGMSRSASTIIGGLFMKFSRKLAAEFSFFLAIPTIVGASLYSLLKFILKNRVAFTNEMVLLLFIGTLVSFIVAYGIIAFFMNFVKKRPLYVFVVYRYILAIVIFILYFNRIA